MGRYPTHGLWVAFLVLLSIISAQLSVHGLWEYNRRFKSSEHQFEGVAAYNAGNYIDPMNFLARISGPVRVGLIFCTVAVILSIIGALRSTEPNAGVSSIIIATVISGVVWGVIAWAVATAVMDVEEEIEERDGATLE